MSVFKELIKTLEPTLKEIQKQCGTDYQPKNPFYAFQRMDEVVENGTEPVCIILGQDPYPQDGVATGLAFANKKDITSPSLRNIYLSLIGSSDLKECSPSRPFDASLEGWVKQGIMPLNSSLTVKTNCPGSHFSLWLEPMVNVITTISDRYPKLCWIMLGSQARMFEPCIKRESYILRDAHPAYYARQKVSMPPYVWVKANKYCKETFNKEIDWFAKG